MRPPTLSTKPRKTLRLCPSCECDEGVTIVRDKNVFPKAILLSHEYDIVSCAHCGFIYSDVQTTEERFGSYYSNFSKYDSLKNSSGSGGIELDQLRLQKQAARIAAHIIDTNAVIVDIGCGSGGLLLELRKLGFKNLIGCDASERCVANVQSEGIQSFRYLLGSPFPYQKCADVVILSHVLEHLLAPRSALQVLKDILNEEGRIYAEVPDAMAFRHYTSCLGYEINVEHINYFSIDTFSYLMAKAGFYVEIPIESTFEIANGLYPVLGLFAHAASSEVATPPVFRQNRNFSRYFCDYSAKSSVYLEGLRKHLLKYMAIYDKVILWGAGMLLYKLLASSEIDFKRIIAIIDSNTALEGHSIADIPVVSPQFLKQAAHKNEQYPVIITGLRAEASIVRAAADLRYKGYLFSLVEQNQVNT